MTHLQSGHEPSHEGLAAENAYIKGILRSMFGALLVTDLKGKITAANHAALSMLEFRESELLGRPLSEVVVPMGESRHPPGDFLADVLGWSDDQIYRTKSGREVPVAFSSTLLLEASGEMKGAVCVALDITERKHLEAERKRLDTERKRLENELYQAQKLEALGRLASGIAHEINTPIQFIADNAVYLRTAYHELLALVASYGAVLKVCGDSMDAQTAKALADAEQAADLAYQEENAPKALDALLEGVHRVAEIVLSMKAFAHSDSREKTPSNINEAIANTLKVSQAEWKYVAEVETDLGQLPLVPCYLGELNQVVLSMVVNAAHAISDVVKGTNQKGTIRVATWAADGMAVISIADSGTGIPAEIQCKVFEPFFTTKEVGRGTGQGLAVARSVIVEKHAGILCFETEPGKGTTFFIRLPLTEGATPTV